MAIRHLVIASLVVALLLIALFWWLIPLVLHYTVLVFAILLVYAGVRILLGPTTKVPEGKVDEE